MQNRSLSIEYKYTDLPEDFPIRLIRFTEYEQNSNLLSFHNCLEIGVCCEGNGAFFVNNRMIQYNKNDISIIFPDQPHRFHVPTNPPSLWNFIFVDIERLFCNMGIEQIPELIDMLHTEHNISPLFCSQNNEELSQIIRSIFDELQYKDKNHRFIVKQYIFILLLKLLRLSCSYSQPDASVSSNNLLAISPAINFIIENYDKEICLDDLSKKCNLSKSYLRKLFINTIGFSPCEYLAQTRLRIAKTLLNSTSLSITTVACDVGYDNVTTFDRQFKNNFHISPSEYRIKFLSELSCDNINYKVDNTGQ